MDSGLCSPCRSGGGCPGRTGERTASRARLAATTRPGSPAMPWRPRRLACLASGWLSGAVHRRRGGRSAARSCCSGGGPRRGRGTRIGRCRRARRRRRIAALRASTGAPWLASVRLLSSYSPVPYAAPCRVARRVRPVRCGSATELSTRASLHRAAEGMPWAGALLNGSRPASSVEPPARRGCGLESRRQCLPRPLR
jgi:hypothetical protein